MRGNLTQLQGRVNVCADAHGCVGAPARCKVSARDDVARLRAHARLRAAMRLRGAKSAPMPPRALMPCRAAKFLLSVVRMRDVAHRVRAEYVVCAVQPVDMFLHTEHVECVVLLTWGRDHR